MVTTYPNPAKDNLTVSWDNHDAAAAYLFDSRGRQVMNEPVLNSGDAINLNGLEEGVYVLQLEIQGRVQTQKGIIQ